MFFLSSCIDARDVLEDTSQSDQFLNVLFIGSSFGVNTFVQFPALAISAGIKVTGGNLYKGACTLHDVAEICKGNGNFESSAIYNYKTCCWESASRNILELLRYIDWDVIVLQRAAPGLNGGSDQWTEEMAADMQYIISFIQENSLKKPKFLFNACFSRPVGVFGSREKQFESVGQIIATSHQVYEEFGIDVIPSATAIQNARITSLADVQTFNSKKYSIPDLTGDGDHLDTGLGSYILGCLMFLHICGPLYDLKISDIEYIPTIKDVHNNAGGFGDECFTPITREQSVIVKDIVLTTINSPWNVDMALSLRYPSL